MKENKAYLRLASAVTAIFIAGGVVYGLYAWKPEATKRRPSPLVPIVEAVKIMPGSEDIYIEASGTAIPAREAVIYTEVEGKITEINSDLVPGGLVADGDLLVRIDPADYELRVGEQKAAMEGARSRLDLEKGQQLIAREEWRIFENEHAAGGGDNSLALREPHLRSAEAEVDAARSRLASAALALEKTVIRAPFNGVIIEESAEVGQFVGRQAKIATLAGTDHFWVQASILPAHIDRIFFPGKGQKGSSVKVILETSGGGQTIRKGRVEKLLGDLDPQGRMARILVKIDDPLNIAGGNGKGKVLLGSFVRLDIEAGKIHNVYTIPREAVIDGDRLLVLKGDGTLDIRKARVKWRRDKDLLLEAEINEGERLIVSRLRNPLPGMNLRTADEKQPPADGKKKGSHGEKK